MNDWKRAFINYIIDRNGCNLYNTLSRRSTSEIPLSLWEMETRI